MSRLIIVTLALLSSLAVSAHAKPALCPDGRFLLPDGVALLSASLGHRQGIALATGTIVLDQTSDPAGATFRQTISGIASGPEGSYVRVNVTPLLGGQLTCASWSSAPCPAGVTLRLCCQRQVGEPASATFIGTLPFPGLDICLCPPPPSVEAGHLLAQLVTLDNDAIAEDARAIIRP